MCVQGFNEISENIFESSGTLVKMYGSGLKPVYPRLFPGDKMIVEI